MVTVNYLNCKLLIPNTKQFTPNEPTRIIHIKDASISFCGMLYMITTMNSVGSNSFFTEAHLFGVVFCHLLKQLEDIEISHRFSWPWTILVLFPWPLHSFCVSFLCSFPSTSILMYLFINSANIHWELPLTSWLICTRHCRRHFCVLFLASSEQSKELNITIPVYVWVNWGSEMSSNLFNISQLGTQAGIRV